MENPETLEGPYFEQIFHAWLYLCSQITFTLMQRVPFQQQFKSGANIYTGNFGRVIYLW